MQLTARIDGHGVSLTCADSGYMDAAVVRTLAGLELEIKGELRVSERDDGRSKVLSLSMSPARLRELGVLALLKSGAPALTEPQWHQIVGVLRTSPGDENTKLADQIQRQLSSGGVA